MSKASQVLCAVSALITGCDDDHDDTRAFTVSTLSASTPTAWFDLQLTLVETTPGFSPPVASRAFAYSGVTLYEAVVHGMPGYVSLAGTLNGLDSLPQPEDGAHYYWPEVANAALAAMTRDMFPTTSDANLAAIDELETRQATDFAVVVSPAVIDRSAAYGRALADAIYAWSVTDGGDEGYLHNYPASYTPPTGRGKWVPTPPMYSPAMQPYWGKNRTFVLASTGECAVPPPLTYSTDPEAPFVQQAREVYLAVRQATPEQQAIVHFWADSAGTSTPAGHSISIVTQELLMNNSKLDVAAEAYARVSLAVADSFIALWAAKYRYNLIRPVTFIQQQMNPGWMPMIATPPFPEYPSGHSVQSGAAAEVLTELFGNVSFTDHTHDEDGMQPRTFRSFQDAAQEAAISRLYGGIHYRAAIENGLAQGRCIGDQINALVLHP